MNLEKHENVLVERKTKYLLINFTISTFKGSQTNWVLLKEFIKITLNYCCCCFCCYLHNKQSDKSKFVSHYYSAQNFNKFITKFVDLSEFFISLREVESMINTKWNHNDVNYDFSVFSPLREHGEHDTNDFLRV
jgi:hypothetical protein